MAIRSKFLLYILNQLPAFIVLLFGMISLYYCVLLIDMHDKAGLHNNIAAVEVTSSDRTVYQVKNKALHAELKKYEVTLYWAIIAMGLAGFVLSVLNAHRLRQLALMNRDKEKSLSVLESHLAAMEMSHDGILIVDKDSKISFLNKSACLINGIDEGHQGQFLNKTWDQFFTTSSFDIIQEKILPSLEEKPYWVGEFSFCHSDETITHTDLSLTRLPDGGLICTIQDISERHQAEIEKKTLEEQFFQAQKMEAIGRLAGGIAHDFNNILAAMNGYSELLIDDLKEQEEQHCFAQNILKAGMQARGLVDQMLAFSRRGESTREPIDLVSSVNEAILMLRATLPKTVELNSNFSSEDAFIVGNTTHISQMIMNLCVNALDAMDDGHGVLDVSVDVILSDDIGIDGLLCEALPDDSKSVAARIIFINASTTQLVLGHVLNEKEYVRLQVKDTGAGMSRSVMKKIFEPFFTTKSVDKGTGLGLATVHGIILSHEGAMVINTQLGNGTSFDLYFPIVAEQKLTVVHDDSDVLESNEDVRHSVLLVDDNQTVSFMMLKMLERLGYEAVLAEDGLEAMKMVRADPDGFDLVITDHNMPKMTGLEMVEQLSIEFPELPFIVVSGYNEQKINNLIKGHKAIKSVMRKPVSREDLSKGIKAALREAA